MDSLETIVGSLDVRTLCTARLVCRSFSQLASGLLHTLKLPAKDLPERRSFLPRLLSSPAVGFSHFPKARRVTISGVKPDNGDFQRLTHPNVRAAVTDLEVILCRVSGELKRFTLPTLSNLRSLTVPHYGASQCLTLPTTLQELSLEGCVACPSAEALMGLTNLTSLTVSVSAALDLSSHPSCHSLTVLSALQRLTISCRESSMPSVTMLTQLTHLVWLPNDRGPGQSLLPFTAFQKLAHLGIGVHISSLGFESISRITTLRSLDIASLSRAFRGAGLLSVLGCLSLTSLGLDCYSLDRSFLARTTLKGLEALALGSAGHLSEAHVHALKHATALTQLEFFLGILRDNFQVAHVCQSLSCMSRLQALSLSSLNVGAWDQYPSCSNIVGAVTGLTRLSWVGELVTDADLAACAGLRKLRMWSLTVRSMRLFTSPITHNALLKLAKSPELSVLKLYNLGVCNQFFPPLTDEALAEVNCRRLSRGWPDLDIRRYGGRG